MPENDDIRRIVRESDVRCVYQPIVDLDSETVVAYEALIRGPAGSSLEHAHDLFAAARATGLLAQLDWVCRTEAIKGAVEARLRPPTTLFVNSEPESVGSLMPVDFAETWATAKLAYMRLIFEVTERGIMQRPAELFRHVAFLRSLGWGIAIDDVGVDPQSLGLLPYLRPDVIKLDMSAVQAPDAAMIETIFAINAEVERGGALILAEGVETEEHLERARMFGAKLVQGWYFGRPVDRPVSPSTTGRTIHINRIAAPDPDDTPFGFLRDRRRVATVPARHLVEMCEILERRAAQLPYPPVVVAAFQRADRLTPRTKRRFELLAEGLPYVAVLAQGVAADAVTGARCAPLSPGDPLTKEWIFSAISPYTALILAARDLGGSGPDRPYETVMSFDRDLVVEASLLMLSRLVAPSEGEEQALADLTDYTDFAVAMTNALAEAQTLEDLARPLLDAMASVTGLESTFLSKVNVTHDDYQVLFARNDGSLDVPEGAQIPWTYSICKSALEAGKQSFADVQAELPESEAAREFGFRTFVTCPVLMQDGKIAGTLCGASSEPGGLSDRQHEMVRSFAEVIAKHLHFAVVVDDGDKVAAR